MQVPRLPASAHERHVPVQLELQQTPCWHCPEAHSTPVVHTVPGVFFAHWPVMQTLGATQSASAEQDARHVPFVPHWNGSQGTAVDRFAERFTVDEFRCDEIDAFGVADLVHRDDVRMIQ